MIRRPLVRCILFASALAAGGCVPAQHRTPVVQLPSAYVGATEGGGDTAIARWWLLFGDDQLTRLVSEALRNAPQSRQATAVLDEATAFRSQALARFQPQGGVSTSANLERTRFSNAAPAVTQGTFSGSFSPSWEIGLFGRARAARQVADADLDAARFDYHASRQSLASAVAGDLFEARANALRLAQAQDTLRIATDLANVSERRVLVGIGARVDAISLKADEASAREQVQELEALLDVSKRTLLILLGRGAEGTSSVPITPDLDTPPTIPIATPATLLRQRPDVLRAEAALRSEAGTLKLDSRALLPSLNLAPALGASATTGPLAFSTGLWSIGAGLALPVLDRHRLLAEVRGQRARTEQAVIAYENAVQAGFGEAQNYLRLYSADLDRLSSLETAERLARTAFEAQRTGYGAGVVELTTLLQAERTWRSNRAALSDLRASTLIDAVNLFKALGGGWSDDTGNQADQPYPFAKGL